MPLDLSEIREQVARWREEPEMLDPYFVFEALERLIAEIERLQASVSVEALRDLPRYQAKDVAREFEHAKTHLKIGKPVMASPLVGVWRDEYSVLKWSEVAALLAPQTAPSPTDKEQ